uniref:Uncharacterized protein n=1 Tax=Bracon brevicornis TaxID=1563983 RepID=A0A6V7JM28_9HYME
MFNMSNKKIVAYYDKCKKIVVRDKYECTLCNKLFHQSCAKLHRSYNSDNELILCPGEVTVVMNYTENLNSQQEWNVNRASNDEQGKGDTTHNEPNQQKAFTQFTFVGIQNLNPNITEMDKEGDRKRRRVNEHGDEFIQNNKDIYNKVDEIANKIDELREKKNYDDSFEEAVRSVLKQELTSIEEKINNDMNSMKNEIIQMKKMLTEWIMNEREQEKEERERRRNNFNAKDISRINEEENGNNSNWTGVASRNHSKGQSRAST